MKRPELVLGGVLIAVASFIAIQARRAPTRAESAAQGEPAIRDPIGAEGLELSRVSASALPAPPPKDFTDIAARLREAKTTTYMDAMLAARANNVARWVDRRQNPILVWVQPRPNIRGFWPEFRDRARDAFYAWAAAGVPLKFLFIDDSTAAEVRVRWVEQFRDAAAGRTYWSRDANFWIVEADIELATHRSNGQAYDAMMIRTIALHEVGHLIGLDHSPNPDDIMHARVRVTSLSPSDLRTANLVYKLPPGAVTPP